MQAGWNKKNEEQNEYMLNGVITKKAEKEHKDREGIVKRLDEL